MAVVRIAEHLLVRAVRHAMQASPGQDARPCSLVLRQAFDARGEDYGSRRLSLDYGSRRLSLELEVQNHVAGHHRAPSLRKRKELRNQWKRKFAHATDSITPQPW